MKEDPLDQIDAANPHFNDALLAKDLHHNRLRVKELLDNFVVNAVLAMDTLTLALKEGKKDDAIRKIDCLMQLSCAIHAQTLENILGSLRSAVWNDEATDAVQKIVAKTQTAFQGTIALAKQYLVSQI